MGASPLDIFISRCSNVSHIELLDKSRRYVALDLPFSTLSSRKTDRVGHCRISINENKEFLIEDLSSKGSCEFTCLDETEMTNALEAALKSDTETMTVPFANYGKERNLFQSIAEETFLKVPCLIRLSSESSVIIF